MEQHGKNLFESLSSLTEMATLGNRALQSEGCASALQNAGTQIMSNTECLSQLESFDQIAGSSGSVEAFCTGDDSCRVQIATLFNTINDACSGEELEAMGDSTFAFGDVSLYLELICLQRDGEYCLTKLGAVTDMMDSDSGLETFDAETIEQFCSPCVKEMFEMLMATLGGLGDGSDGIFGGFFDVMCTKVDGEYCMVQFSDMSTVLESPTVTAEDYNMLCEPCPRILFSSMITFGMNDTMSGSEIVRSLCDADAGDGATCMSKFGQYSTAMGDASIEDSCPDPTTLASDSACSDSCKTEAQDFVTSLGCCWNIIAEIVAEGDSEQVSTFFAEQCGISVPDACPLTPLEEVTVTLSVRNLSPIFASENAEAVCNAIKPDIARWTVSDPENIECTVDESGNVVIKIRTSVPSTTSSLASDASNLILDNLNTSLPSSAKEDPTISFDGATASAVSTAASTTSGAALLTHGSWISVFFAISVAFGSFV
jgi:hypothetical protein